jgi:gliding motility-associated-like protein
MLVLKHTVKIIFSLLFLAIFSAGLNAQNISGIVNSYVNVTSVGLNSVLVSNASNFNVGDEVLLIQMKGASITNGNVQAFGTITNLNNAGNFEFATILSKSGNTLTFTSNLCKAYTVSGLVQLVKVAVYNNVTISAPLTSQAWNGTTGGIVAIRASGSITFNAGINVSGAGFIGGTFTTGFFSCGDMNWANSSANAGRKGEGIAQAPVGQDGNRAPLANGGGGSNSGNPGAGGGGNGGSGGRGGNEWYGSCQLNSSFGVGGFGLNYSNYKAFLGGGGGGGYRDNGLTATAGSNGGGMVFLIAPLINGNNNSINASGANVLGNTDSEGAGAGGAGGCVYLLSPNIASPLTINVKGGNGGNIFSTLWAAACHGPGGGGGGGTVCFATPVVPLNIVNQLVGGNSGMVLHNGPACTGTAHGALPGNNGQQLFNYQLSVPGPSPNLGVDTAICSGQSVSLSLDTVFSSYLWNNGANTPSIQVSTPGVYWVEVPSGCGFQRDSIVVSLNTTTVNLGPDVSFCQGDSVIIQVNGNYASQLWSNGANSSSIISSNPGLFGVLVTDFNGCVAADSILLSELPIIITFIDDSICQGTNYNFNGMMLNVSGIFLDSLQSSYGCDSIVHLNLTTTPLPIVTVNNESMCKGESVTLIPNGAVSYQWAPISAQGGFGEITVSPINTTSYQVIGQDQHACFSLPANALVTVYPSPLADFYFNPSTISMGDPTAHIVNTSLGALAYTWTISGTSFIQNQSEFDYVFPFTEGSQTVYLVAESSFGCLDSTYNSIQITNDFSVYVPNSFTPDGDEHNHVFKPIFSGDVDPSNFGLWIYNRWGELVFESHDVAAYWDGNFANYKAQEGVYSYILSYSQSTNNDLKSVVGSFSLLR